MVKKTKLAIIVAGGNGAGKSTFINNQLLPLYEATNVSYINADDWQKKTFGEFDNTTTHQAKQAQDWAETERKKHLEQGKSFIAETVFSHPSKIQLIQEAKAQGFQVNLYHISLDNSDMALDRINERVLLGGHDVDAEKVKNRYERVKDIIVEAIKYADKTFVYDNSVLYRPHEKILSLDKENVVAVHSSLPEWVIQTYKQPLNVFYEKLKEQFTAQQKNNFNDLELVIKEQFKNNPVLLEQKLNLLNQKIPTIISNNISIQIENISIKDKDKGR